MDKQMRKVFEAVNDLLLVPGKTPETALEQLDEVIEELEVIREALQTDVTRRENDQEEKTP